MSSAPVLAAGIVDRHVHLGLVDRAQLVGGPVVEVHDLGWRPDEASAWRDDPPRGVTIRVAGPFLAPPRGYPTGRSWAPSGCVEEIPDADAARAAIVDAAARRNDLVKVTLHTAFPPFPPGVLETLVRAAREEGIPVVAHAEGRGTARTALDAGVDALAHVPWTERLDSRTIAHMAERVEWISTLALHTGWARRVALGNARRFVTAGGRLRYGTDAGNGSEPMGLRVREIEALGEAGLAGPALLEALSGVPGGAVDGRVGERGTVVGHSPMPTAARDVAAWYQAARPTIEGTAP